MAPKDASALTYSLAELGIDLSSEGKPLIHATSDTNSRFKRLDVAFDQQTGKWICLHPDDLLDGSSAKPANKLSTKRPSSTSWVDNLPDTEHVQSFRAIEWSTTSLGPLQNWPIALQTYVNLLMVESVAAAIYWGSDLSAIYNAEMCKLSQERLDRCGPHMGKSFKELWPEQWTEFGPMLMEVVERGVPLDTLNVTLYPERNGVLEETFFTGTFIPIRDPEGNIQGFFNRGRETTKEVVAERRTKTLNTIALPTSVEGNLIWEHLFSAFRANDREFPMAFAYKATEEADSGIKLQLQQGIGLPKGGHALVPGELDLFGGQNGFPPYFRRANGVDQPLLLHKANGTLPDALVHGFEWQGFAEPSNSIAIMAINASERLLGVVVVGLNPRRPYDLDYEGFLNSLARQISSIVSNAVDKEESKLRAKRLRQRLEESERQIREIAVHGPVGMVQVALNGKIQWANDQFFELTGHSRASEDQYELSFVDVVDPIDQELCTSRWTMLTEERKTSTVALRLKRRWKPPANPDGQENVEEPVWVTASAYPIVEDGELKYIASAVTDISHFKWAEAVQSRNAASAKEDKRLQENFIDIVSHEIRNPLSAITQLADSISDSLKISSHQMDLRQARSIINDNVESAKTILLCAAHQKRIIDDVLTLSKLDSMMLSITPIIVQPRKVVAATLKMFEGEFQTNDIKFHAEIDLSYTDLDVDWVYLDPSRLTQIFINLITNAIKFTKLEEKREIMVRSSVNKKRPPTLAGVTWFSTNKKYRDLTQGKEWGTGEEVYFCFEVRDTGRGLEQEEMKKLFSRFQQATAKTHIKYGGSGLGLFISRELTETQGGEIGVKSEPGKGSTFAFYVKGRKADPPDDPAEMPTTPLKEASEDEIILRATSSSDRGSVHSGSDPELKKHVVLLVEDNVVNAKVLTRQLERAKCEVHIANHGMEALDFLSKTRSWIGSDDESLAVDLDCILMDAEMPIMDGLTCTRRIRQLEEEGRLSRHINIIAITANARPEQITTVMSAGADGVMPKPFRVKELLDKIEELKAENPTYG